MTETIRILAFGVARDILGQYSFHLEMPPACTVSALRQVLLARFPGLSQLNALAIAVNSEYAREDQVIRPGDEVVLIPPVSGG